MDVWGWLIAYIVGFGLLQLTLYTYFQRRDPSPESPIDSPPGGVDSSRGSVASSGQNAEEVVHCDRCGARNDAHQMIRYCGSCTRPLR